MTRALPIILVLLAAALCHAQEPSVPRLTDHVTDLAGLLTSEERASLEAELEAFEDSTSNAFVVLLIPSLGGMPIEQYALQVAEANRIGTEENDNGLLLLISVEDRQTRVEVGYGLEGAVTDAVSALVLENELKPRFRAGDYHGGLQAALQALMQASAGEYQAEPRSEAPEGIGLGTIFLLIIVFVIISRGSRRGRRGGGGFGGGVLPWIIASQTMRGGGGWGSSGGSWGGGGGSSGGGFSGGGGSFGGGGASGSW